MGAVALPEVRQLSVDAAVAYAKLGLPVFPAVADPIPEGRDAKQPLFQKAIGAAHPYWTRTSYLWGATTDVNAIRRHWPADAGVAIAPDHVVIDGDVPKASTCPLSLTERQAIAQHRLHQLIERFPELADAPLAETPSGGWHLHIRWPEDQPRPGAGAWPASHDAKAENVDERPWGEFRGSGKGYVLAAPSTIEGEAYVWRRPLNGQLPTASPELVEFLTKPREGAASTIREGTEVRHVRVPTDTAKKLLDTVYRSLAAAPEGSRNNKTYTYARVLGRWVQGYVIADLDGLTEDDAWRVLIEANQANGDWTDGPDAERKCQRTISNGLRDGMAAPFEVKVPTGGAASPARLSDAELASFDAGIAPLDVFERTRPAPASIAMLKPDDDSKLAFYPHTDAGNAERLVRYAAGLLRYAPGIGWLRWIGDHWAPDPSELVMRLALDTMRATAITAERLRAQRDDQGDKLHKHARASENVGRLRAMLEIARIDPAIHVLADRLDADPWALNTESGLVNLRDGTVGPHDPAALCTRLAPVRYDLDAEHWALDALLDILDRDGRAEYLRRIAGQALSGRGVKAAYVFTGEHGTVKSTTADALAAILGPYAVSVEPSTLTTSRHGHNGGAPRADLVALRGARLALSAELPNGGRLDSELIKRLTGRDPITARAPHAREVLTFTPGHTLVMHTNHDPRTDWHDSGMRARLRVIPFTVRPDKPNPRVRDALTSDSDARAAVLAWAVAGAVCWYRNNEDDTEPPAVVQERTQAYWLEQDPFEPWAEDALVFDSTSEVLVPTKVLAEDYARWCDVNGERQQSTRALGVWLRDRASDRGIRSAKGAKGVRGWLGLRLRGDV